MNKAPAPIPMKPVKSSQVHSHGYDPVTKTLAVKFNTGSLYHYHVCPHQTMGARCA